MKEQVFAGVQLMRCADKSDGMGCSRESEQAVRVSASAESVVAVLPDGAELSRMPSAALCCVQLSARSVAVRPRAADSHVAALVFQFACAADAQAFVTILAPRDVSKAPGSLFDLRTEESSAAQYFQFYGYLSQQQNMMQDFIRTETYQRAMLSNLGDFKDKVVLDVGAGSGILSFFAAQAGARMVYAVEASNMAQYCEELVRANGLSDRIRVLPGKIEEVSLPEQVDVIVSEPMGYMLLNERMLETYLHAKKFLKPAGKMYPTRGDLHVAPFTDEALYLEQTSKAAFWTQDSFHGVNLAALRPQALAEYFKQPVVDTWHTGILVSRPITWKLDFLTAAEADLQQVEIPFDFEVLSTAHIHGLAFWFDVAFIGGTQTVWLSTSPTEPLTHWYQVRCLLQHPVFAKRGQRCTGRVFMLANSKQSYDVDIEVCVDGRRSKNSLDLKNPFFRYTGQPVLPPAGTHAQSPTDAYWSTTGDMPLTPIATPVVNGPLTNGYSAYVPSATAAVPAVGGGGAANIIDMRTPRSPMVPTDGRFAVASAHAAYARGPMAATIPGQMPLYQSAPAVASSNGVAVSSQQHRSFSSYVRSVCRVGHVDGGAFQQQQQCLPFTSPGYPPQSLLNAAQHGALGDAANAAASLRLSSPWT